MRTRPPRSRPPRIVSGGQPVAHVTSAPSARSASASTWIGRFAMASSPTSVTSPSTSAATAARNRTVVPLLPTKSGPSGACSRARPPCTIERVAGPASSMSMPMRVSAARMCRVSSLSSAPVSRVSPSASAASTRARLVMLFDPGTAQVTSTGPGRRGMTSGATEPTREAYRSAPRVAPPPLPHSRWRRRAGTTAASGRRTVSWPRASNLLQCESHLDGIQPICSRIAESNRMKQFLSRTFSLSSPPSSCRGAVAQTTLCHPHVARLGAASVNGVPSATPRATSTAP